jgi:capsular exopolysaccharide synthesis family protein
MSLIFDALQRSEGERSGVDLSALSAATELLQRVERQTVSERETTLHPELADRKESADRDIALQWPAVPSVVSAVESSVEDEISLNEKRANQIAQFQSLQIPLPSQSQLVCLTGKESLAEENFRFLGVRLRHLRRERPLQRVLITSTIPREGKSTVAANLACTLARKKQQRTLLLEGDVRRPSLTKLFGLDSMPGLCELLQRDDNKITNIYRLEGPNLWILPAGSASGNPLELLQSGRLTSLMDQLTSLFDWIIIDSPPVLPLADTSVLSRLADGILLVARQGVTEKRQLQRGLEAVDHKKLIGALLNGSHSSAAGDHYYYYRPSTASGADIQNEE